MWRFSSTILWEWFLSNFVVSNLSCTPKLLPGSEQQIPAPTWKRGCLLCFKTLLKVTKFSVPRILMIAHRSLINLLLRFQSFSSASGWFKNNYWVKPEYYLHSAPETTAEHKKYSSLSIFFFLSFHFVLCICIYVICAAKYVCICIYMNLIREIAASLTMHLPY